MIYLEEFVKIPSLPDTDVTVVFSKPYAPLRELGIKIIETSDNPALDGPVRAHADMLCCHLGGNRCIVDREDTVYTQQLRQAGFDVFVCSPPLSRDYPQDIRLNALILGGYLIGKQSHISPLLRYWALSQGFIPINTRQGYTRCSVCVVDHHAVITADAGLFQILTKLGFSVLKIDAGDIILPGYDYGFIGGCYGHLGADLLAFTGHLRHHRNFHSIEAFCKQHGKKIVYLHDGPLHDIGGILPLKQKAYGRNQV